MRLLNTKTLQLEELDDAERADYCILSHTWDREETSFQEMRDPTDKVRQKLGYRKALRSCQVALLYGFSYIWIDSCCIDKTSSAELSETINSMYRYYLQAKLCIIYFADVPAVSSAPDGTQVTVGDQHAAMKSSRWFARGWTLQELIASSSRRLYLAKDWSEISFTQGGNNITDVNELVSEITNIPVPVLVDHTIMSTLCISERMSWQAKRQTTRAEDMAYSLLGIFNVNMPIIYGEGIEKAFRRLQEEIMKTSGFDHSLFAWHSSYTRSGLLAKSPYDFADPPTVRLWHPRIVAPYGMTNVGIRLQLIFIKDDPRLPTGITFAILACDAKSRLGWGNILLRLERLDLVGLHIKNQSCPSFRRIGSAQFDYAPFNTFRVSWGDAVVLEDEQFELAKLASQHHATVRAEVKSRGSLSHILLSGQEPILVEDSIKGPSTAVVADLPRLRDA